MLAGRRSTRIGVSTITGASRLAALFLRLAAAVCTADDALVGCIEQHFGPRVEIIGKGAGLHVVVRFSGTSMSEAGLINLAAQNGIRLFPFSVTRASDEPGPLQIMLGFGGMTPAEIEQGVALLAHICPRD